MRKNKMMRFASLVLVLTLLSTCAISGTFAKYTTSDSASDSARVAKWGVTLTATNSSNFAESYTYDSSETDKKGTLAVQVDTTGTKVVAPGTGDAQGVTFKISGTPEVATKVDIKMDVTKDVFVKGGDGSNAYCPVVFTLKQTEGKVKGDDDSWTDITTDTAVEVATGTLWDIEKAIEEYAKTAYYAPNTNLAATFVLTWAWDFDASGAASGAGTNDKNDTLLGNLAAATATTSGEATTKSVDNVSYTEAQPTWSNAETPALTYTDNTYCTDIAYTITFTVTQVD